jgi:glycosyltransferase involved in cell wall biosynthesis
MPIALVTNYLTGYRIPLYKLLAERYDVEVLCFGGGENYVPAWFSDLDGQIARAPFPAHRIDGKKAAFAAAARYDAVIAPYAGGPLLPATYAGAVTRGKRFVLWASIWSQPRSLTHAMALPFTRHVHRHAAAVVAYGEHVKRFVRRLRGRDDDVFVAPQSVEPELFARQVAPAEIEAFRAAHRLEGPIVLYVGRLTPEKGIGVLLDAWRNHNHATLVLIGDGPLASQIPDGVRFLGPIVRQNLPVAYAAASLSVVPSVPTPLWREPWGLVCNEAMHQGRAVIATTAVGAAAGGLVRDGETGLVVRHGDARALSAAIDRLLRDHTLREQLGAAARIAVAPYTYDAMANAFGRALTAAGVRF